MRRRIFVLTLRSAGDIAGGQALIYTAAKCAADPQFRHRGMVREVDDPRFGRVLHAGVVPHVPEDPGQVRWARPAVGAHADEVMTELLGLRPEEIAALRAEGVL